MLAEVRKRQVKRQANGNTETTKAGSSDATDCALSGVITLEEQEYYGH